MLHVVADRLRWQTALPRLGAETLRSLLDGQQYGRRHAALLSACGSDSPARSLASRFIRRLIAERRIEFHKVGRHVRISEQALAEFIENGRVVPVTSARRRVA